MRYEGTAAEACRRPLLSLLLALILLAAGCASLPPAQEAKDLRQIVGKWEGQGGGSTVTMTINENGTYRAVTAGGSEFVGRVQVEKGLFRFKSETTGLSGIMTLYEGDGRRILRTRTDDGTITSEYSPGK
jgi:hypothetical protein